MKCLKCQNDTFDKSVILAIKQRRFPSCSGKCFGFKKESVPGALSRLEMGQFPDAIGKRL